MKKRWPWVLVVSLLVPVGVAGCQATPKVEYDFGWWSYWRTSCGVTCANALPNRDEPGVDYPVHVHWCNATHKGGCDSTLADIEAWCLGGVFYCCRLCDDEDSLPATIYSLKGDVLLQMTSSYGSPTVYRSDPPWTHSLPLSRGEVQVIVNDAAGYLEEEARAGKLRLPSDWECLR